MATPAVPSVIGTHQIFKSFEYSNAQLLSLSVKLGEDANAELSALHAEFGNIDVDASLTSIAQSIAAEVKSVEGIEEFRREIQFCMDENKGDQAAAYSCVRSAYSNNIGGASCEDLQEQSRRSEDQAYSFTGAGR